MEFKLLDNFAPLAGEYDALLCDAWGVIHNGVELVPGIAEALSNFRSMRGPVIILTNAPRPSEIIPPQLDRLGLPRDAYDAVVTSGDATRAVIEKFLPGPAYQLGPDKDDALYQGLEIEFRDIDDASFIVCTGMNDDRRENPSLYRDLLARGVDRQLPMVCANPDITVNWGGRILYCAGALAEIYAELGGEVIFGGKPHRPIYELAAKEIEARGGSPVAKSRILAVGDGLKTDLAGANANGIDILFVTGAGGIHSGGNTMSEISATLADGNVHCVAAMEKLTW